MSDPQNIMQAFRLANDKVAESSSLDEMISAYDQVISFCAGNRPCRVERGTKRDMLLYWAYANIAKAYEQKHLFEAANLYYEKALSVANNNKQKAHILEKMLDVTAQENIRALDKCRKIIAIANQLIAIYKNKVDKTDLRRISALGEKALELLKKAER